MYNQKFRSNIKQTSEFHHNYLNHGQDQSSKDLVCNSKFHMIPFTPTLKERLKCSILISILQCKTLKKSNRNFKIHHIANGEGRVVIGY